jgi:phage FluMu gp28-like protein
LVTASKNNTINYTRPKLVGYQTAILNSPARFTVTEASTKTGKTASHIVWLLEQALQLKPNQSVWWVAPVYAQAEIAFNRMRAQITNKAFFKANESKLTLTLPTGGKIQFKSAEKPDNLYGDDVYAAVFDEFTRAREEAWYALRSTLTKTEGPCKFIGNVKGRNWGYRLAQRAKQGDENFEYFKITCWDAVEAGILSKEEVEQAKRDLPEHVFKELYLAEVSDDGNNPFGLEHIRACIKPLDAMPRRETVAFGVDLAKSFDYTVVMGLDVNGDIVHFDRFQINDWSETKKRIENTVKDYPCYVDSTGVGDPIEEDLRRNCRKLEGFKFSQTSKQQLMEGLCVAIQQRKTSVLEGVHREEMESFEYEYGRTGVKYSAPIGLHDDTVCAHALAWAKFREAEKTGTYIIL